MFGTRHSVAMTDFHRVYINNYELYSDWIIANHYVNSSPLNWKQYRFVSEETKQKQRLASGLKQFLVMIAIYKGVIGKIEG